MGLLIVGAGGICIHYIAVTPRIPVTIFISFPCSVWSSVRYPYPGVFALIYAGGTNVSQDTNDDMVIANAALILVTLLGTLSVVFEHAAHITSHSADEVLLC